MVEEALQRLKRGGGLVEAALEELKAGTSFTVLETGGGHSPGSFEGAREGDWNEQPCNWPSIAPPNVVWCGSKQVGCCCFIGKLDGCCCFIGDNISASLGKKSGQYSILVGVLLVKHLEEVKMC